MMNKNNAYFEELKRIGHEWEAARIERKARKQQIIDTLGWESDELKAWYEEDAAAKFPFEQGVSKAYRAWATSISRKWKTCTSLLQQAARWKAFAPSPGRKTAGETRSRPRSWASASPWTKGGAA